MKSIYLLISTFLMVASDCLPIIIQKDNFRNKHHYNQVEIINYQNQQSTLPISFSGQKKTYLIAQTQENNPPEDRKQKEQPEYQKVMVIALFASFLFLFVISGLIALGGITEKIKVKDKFLGPLFIAVLIEGLCPAVLAFGRPEIIFPDHIIQDLKNEIKNLTEENNNLAEIKKCQDKESELETKDGEIQQLNNKIGSQDKEIITLKAQIAGCVKIDKSFFGKIAKIDDYARSLPPDRTFDPMYTYDPILSNQTKEIETRKEYCQTIQELLKVIGQLEKNRYPNNNCRETARQLAEYQSQKGVKEPFDELYDPNKTTTYLIIDYLEIKGLIDK
ncbi:MAG: hypothetical protein F6K25_07955 [Okeania sp. SIO2G4]|uniref:coiled-coil domain-containing protein n=1 Tax=unclassified Okeania TaxID=2634635 RepID=UPI0013BA0E06|nr:MULTISPECIES: hypothetical protein [unclassified Okeania]NEP04639.1 hypothetical protein [Okeania sp. SIO4D6]NEP39948.1 hypothetical protein [Okeania sp. SIO2H7]NEP73620.1 hypothetical protein [Okeania sp. SIO2G5]NEP97217.1 hypothetical protein [Okeania sp. SIO2F5]NEQ90649.1 hypothetical protein [Okeania sp. SIO2G4]